MNLINILEYNLFAFIVSFAGTHLFCGFDSVVRVFDLSRPGRDCETRKLRRPPNHSRHRHHKSHRGTGRAGRSGGATGEEGGAHVRGLVSTIAFNPDSSGVYAVGTYDGTADTICMRVK